MRRNSGNTWLVILRAEAIDRWLQANHPGIQKTGSKRYGTICGSKTRLTAYLRECSHGMEVDAADRAFVVSASSPKEAALKGMSEFNAATAQMYSPLYAMAIERVVPGPVYLAEIFNMDGGGTEYVPFTEATKHEVGERVRRLAGTFGDVNDYQVKAAAFTRTPAALGRRFVPGTKEHQAFADFMGEMQASVEESMLDDIRGASDELVGHGYEVGLPQEFWSDAMHRAFERDDEHAFADAYQDLKDRNRNVGLRSIQLEGMTGDLEKVTKKKLLTNRRGSRR